MKDKGHTGSTQQQLRMLSAGIMLALLVMVFLSVNLSVPSVAEPPPQERRPTVGEYLVQQAAGESVGPRYEQAVTRWKPEETGPAWAPSPDFTGRFQSMLMALAFVSLLVWGSLKLVGRFAPHLLNGPPGKEPLLKILEKQTLGPGQSICLVEVAGKLMVVGMTEHTISPLCELTQEELEKARAVSEPEAEPARPPAGEAYGSILKHYMSILPGVGARE